MAYVHPLYLERLKSLTLNMAGLEAVLPDDCRTISLMIFEKTNLMVGEDALKRFFGFTASKFGPSIFTLNTLAIYCGFESWEAFPKLHSADILKATYVVIDPLNDPLTAVLMETPTPAVILKTNTPDFTILTYNKAFEAATYTQKRIIKGLSWWEAFAPEKAGGSGPTLLLEAFREVIFTKQAVKMEPLQYNIPSYQTNVATLCWWDIKITPVNYDGVIKYLIMHMNNITDKVIHHDAIEQAIMKELTMAEDLAVTNVKLSSAIKNLAESHDELMQTKQQLEEVNTDLEKRVFERTKKLFESEANQRQLIDNAPVAIGVLKGPDHVVETANKKIIEYWGKDHTVINKPLAVAIPELDGQPFISILDEVRHSGATYVNPELMALLNYNGVMQPRYFDMIYHPIQHSPGVTDSIFIVAVDITEHVMALKKLRESESMLRLAVRAANIGIWAMDPVEKTLNYDAMCAKILGWESDTIMTHEEATAQVTDEFRQTFKDIIEHTLLNNAEYYFTYKHKRFNDGKVIWLRGIGKVTSDDSGLNQVFSGILMEIRHNDADDEVS